MHRSIFAAAVTGCMLAMATAVPAQAEVVSAAPDAFVVRHTVAVTADRRTAWLALITPSKWWTPAHTFSGDSGNLSLMPKADGCFCEVVPAKESAAVVGLQGSVEHMRVILALPDQALRMQGGLGPLQSEPVNAVLTITLSPVDGRDGTRITFEYAVGGYMRFESPAIATLVDQVVGAQIAGLAKMLGPVAAIDASETAVASDTDSDTVTDGEGPDNGGETAGER